MLFLYMIIILQIVLESVPVSSSGHVDLASCLYHALTGQKIIIMENMMHFLHIPTVCIIALFFFTDWWFLICNCRRTLPIIIKLIGATALTDIITAVFFLLIKKMNLISLPLWVGFCITAVLLFSLRWSVSRQQARFSYPVAVALGVVQGIALLPGISRFAAVYTAASWMGFNWNKAFVITWMIQWPLIAAAGAESIVDLYGAHELMPLIAGSFLAVLFTAALGGLLALYGAYWLARSGRIWWLSYYMIIPVLLAYWYC